MTRVVELIEKKRDGGTHSRAELEAIVLGATRGEVPDYQLAAWLMAVVWRGMEDAELAMLTEVMAASGEQLELSNVGRLVADKHSTGGVGDKTSLVVMPLVAACGVPVAKMSGRGLGFTGGTIDKLECFPGIRLDLSARDFVRQLTDVGIVITGQSADLAPADGKLYALRDVTGTVPSIPLIASSVMSKKLAAGAQVIVLDVKAGAGAFMRDPAQAALLARAMVDIGSRAGRRMAAVVSDMGQPLGRAVGHALEVREALATLHGDGPARFQDFAIELATLIVSLATEGRAGRSEVERSLADGRAAAMFRRMVAAQGGDVAAFDDPARLPSARLAHAVTASMDGYVAKVDALTVARSVAALGAARARKGDAIDLAVGVELAVEVGAHVRVGDPLVKVFGNDQARLERAVEMLGDGIALSATPVPPRPLVLDRIAARR
ncbi:MAG: thymidine phosphorylase [Chloroflexi bacterium]|nr:thymidine phosphorylase [Chloroflexota bacterium]